MKIVVRPAAAADIEEAFEWYEQQRPGLGEEFLTAVDSTLDQVAAQPEAFAVIHRATRRALIPHRFPYGLFYRIDGVRPIQPRTLEFVSGLNDARTFYQVLEEPAPLAGMTFPQALPWKSLASAGFQSIVCLTDDTPPYGPSPLQILRSARFEDLHGGRQPPDPKREAASLKDVVHGVARELRAGRGVVVHCQGGTGRTGTVIACTFRLLGMPSDAVLQYMALVNKARQKYPGWKGWPESDWQRRQVELPWEEGSST